MHELEHVIARARRQTLAAGAATGHARTKRLEEALATVGSFTHEVRTGDRHRKSDHALASQLLAEAQKSQVGLTSLRTGTRTALGVGAR